MSYCAIDFGTSNSAIAIPKQDASGMRLVPLEGEHLTMPTAVFYATDRDDQPPGVTPGPSVHDALPRCHGRAAVQAYIDGYEGRLMRSMKSVLGTALAGQTTEVGQGHGVKYLDIISAYLRHLRSKAEAAGGQALTQVVMGRPVFFVDDDPERDAAAQASLEAAAREVGFKDVAFQYEPIAAAFDHEQQVRAEQTVLVADIGGGTSDFSVVRVGPDRAQRLDRRDDILANHGVHVAGTDFDRHVSVRSIMPTMGLGAFGPSIGGQAPRPVPSRVYFDLATWHLINTVYQPARVAELRAMADFYGEAVHHTRLMRVITQRLGHALAVERELADEPHVVGGKRAVQRHLCAGLAARERPAVAPERAEAQRGVLRQVFRRAQRRCARQVVGVGKRRPARLADLARHQAGVGQLAGAQREVQALRHQVEAGVGKHQLHRHTRVARAVVAEDAQQLVVAHVDRQRDAQQALGLVSAGIELRLGLQDVFQPARGLRQVGLTRFGQVQAARRALQQCHAQALLQPGNAHAQRGRGHAHEPGGGAEPTGLRHAHEHQRVVEVGVLRVHGIVQLIEK